jgi:polysaccharide deacetylase 2 family uncharacterized protein YibQ
MNHLKNLAIVILSILVLVQSVLLFHLLAQRRAQRYQKITKELKVWEKEVVTAQKLKEAQKEKEKQKPREIVGKIAIVLDDWGYNLKNSDFITRNNFHVTLSILPFKAYSTQVAKLAYTASKDVIIHMPMEPKNKENYGLEENTLLSGMDKRKILSLLDEAFENVPHALGVSNHMGSRATEDAALMRVVLTYLKQKNCFFLDSLVTSKSVGRPVAKNLKMVFFKRDVFIDNENDPSYIRQQILEVARKAKQDGLAIGIGHDRPTTIAVLKQMILQLQGEGYQFVNLSEVADLDQRN